MSRPVGIALLLGAGGLLGVLGLGFVLLQRVKRVWSVSH